MSSTYTKVSIDELSFKINGIELMSPTGNLKLLAEQHLGAPDTTIKHLQVDNPMCLRHCPPLTPMESLEFNNAPGVDLDYYKKFQWTGVPLKKVVVKDHNGNESVYKIPCIATAKTWHIKGNLNVAAILEAKVPSIECTDTSLSIDDLVGFYQRWKSDEVLHEPPTSIQLNASSIDQNWMMVAMWGAHKKITIRSD